MGIQISEGEKRINTHEAIEAAIARARSVNPEVNAIVTESFKSARRR
jgi:Asp-tRNA(Asn)/Glu-tRNA(Gln) amidotransferase A subunit family amidase